jgi:hypothetical protein
VWHRPTFVTGGIGNDTIRKIEGTIGHIEYVINALTGVFTQTNNITGIRSTASSNSNAGIKFDSTKVVPTGLENSPRTLSSRYWRRVA